MISAFIAHHKLPTTFSDTAQTHYIPVADHIFNMYFLKNVANANSVYFVGINGCQGSGKSTFTDFISKYLRTQYQLNVVAISLDDFYLSRVKRQKLAQNIHPLFATRGVPSTHDMEMLNTTLSSLAVKNTGFTIPRFDKASDEPLSKTQWLRIDEPIDIVLLEGWCWGVTSQTDEQLFAPINELELHQDSDQTWRNHVNDALKEVYEPLYSYMDYWLAIKAPSINCVYQWRAEQERKLQKINEHLVKNRVMSATEILKFTKYFQRLTEQSFHTICQSADIVFHLDSERNIEKIVSKDSIEL